MKKQKIEFRKLIGNHYSIQTKMAVLDWMLKTGQGIEHRYSKWYRDGISKSLFAYSANNYDHKSSLPDSTEWDWYFDAIFARAVYEMPNKPLKQWREKESIFPNKYRMLSFNDEAGTKSMCNLVYFIKKFKGNFLKKEFHHPGYANRTDPKILDISIFTLGNGWIVEYMFAFKEHNYEPGWTNSFRQTQNESVWSFLDRAYNQLQNLIKP